MDVPQLRYFVHIAEAGSLSGAADRLHISQSALSRQVRLLEDELDVQLLKRHARGVTVTPQGGILLRRARKILRQIEQVRDELGNTAKDHGRPIAVGVAPTIGQVLLGPLMQDHSSTNPAVRFRHFEGVGPQLLEWLQEGRIDIALMLAPVDAANLSVVPLVSDDFYLVGIDDRWNLPDPCGANDLKNVPIITLNSRYWPRVDWAKRAAEKQQALEIVAEVQSVELLKELALSGVGCGILPFSTVHREIRAEQLFGRRLKGTRVRRVLVYRSDRELPEEAEAFTEAILAKVTKLQAAGVFSRWPGVN